jgi:hypothetical protein
LRARAVIHDTIRRDRTKQICKSKEVSQNLCSRRKITQRRDLGVKKNYLVSRLVQWKPNPPMRSATRISCVALCLCLWLALSCTQASVSINPRPVNFSVYKFLVENSQYLTDYWRQMRFQKMAVSPFSFYRGSAALFWQDWLGNPAISPYGSAKTVVWVQGDLHIENYGAYQDDSGHIVYEVNDFDEGCPEQYQGDLWRLATSIVLVCQEGGLSAADTANVVTSAAKAYRKALVDYASGVNPNKVTCLLGVLGTINCFCAG